MLDIEKAESGAPPSASPGRWKDLVNSIDAFIDSSYQDRRAGYLELKKYADARIARLDSPAQTQAVALMDEDIPELQDRPTDLDGPWPYERLDRLIRTVVDHPDRWLETPSEQLGWRKPGDLIGTAEEGKLVSLLQAVDQGLF